MEMEKDGKEVVGVSAVSFPHAILCDSHFCGSHLGISASHQG